MRSTLAVTALILGGWGCSADDEPGDGVAGTPSTTPSSTQPSTEASSPSATAQEVLELEDGPIPPGRYHHVLTFECEKGDTVSCPPNPTPPAPVDVEVTVPEGWEAATDFRLLYPTGRGEPADVGGPTNDPDGAGLVIGWTNFHVGLNSDPCARNHDGHLVPDIEVGPTVDDFADAVVDHPTLDVTRPTRTKVGGRPARFFELTGPADISECDDWRPWDPGFYVQGPDNHWDVWAVDVDGTRIVVVAQYFPGTSDEIVTGLHDMVESMTFSS